MLLLVMRRWSIIAGRVPGRTDNEIKNYWNTNLSKKLAVRGIDPKTHKKITTTDSINNRVSDRFNQRKLGEKQYDSSQRSQQLERNATRAGQSTVLVIPNVHNLKADLKGQYIAGPRDQTKGSNMIRSCSAINKPIIEPNSNELTAAADSIFRCSSASDKSSKSIHPDFIQPQPVVSSDTAGKKTDDSTVYCSSDSAAGSCCLIDHRYLSLEENSNECYSDTPAEECTGSLSISNPYTHSYSEPAICDSREHINASHAQKHDQFHEYDIFSLFDVRNAENEICCNDDQWVQEQGAEYMQKDQDLPQLHGWDKQIEDPEKEHLGSNVVNNDVTTMSWDSSFWF